MTDYKKYINALRKCAKEHEDDFTSFGHIIVSDLCRDTANLLENLEQEPFINKPCVSSGVCEHDKQKVLDKIRAEMFEEMLSHSGTGEEVIQAYADGLKKGLDILDKYKVENEG